MAEDLEVGVLLQPKNDLEDEVSDQEVAVGGGGGDLTPGQREQQQSSLAGAFRTALVATGVIGLLASLKPITSTVSAILGIISRKLIPIIEEVADILRPAIEQANEIAAAPQEAIRGVQRGARQFQEQPNVEILRALGFDENQIRGENQGTNENEGIVDVFEGLGLFGGPQSADQTGEATKNKFKNAVDDAKRDKTGSFR